MKKILFYFSVLSTFILLNSCSKDNQIRKDIVGSYYYTDNDMEEEDVIISIEGIETYNQDGSITNVETLTVTIIDEDGDKIKLYYDFSISGTYEIKNAHVIYDYNFNSIKFQAQKSNNYVSRLVYQYVESILSDHFIPGVKQGLLENFEMKVVRQHKQFLVLADREGNESTFKRVSPTTTNRQESNTETKQSEKIKQNEEPTPPLRFVDFIDRFAMDENYQLNHIKFPLNNNLTKDKWEYLNSDIIFNGRKEFEGYILEGTLEKSDNDYVYKLGIPESELFYSLLFRKIEGEWFLIEFIDVQAEIEDARL